jgi:hypothetical protein
MAAKSLRTRCGAGYLLPGHAQDVRVRSSAVPDGRRSRQQVSGPSPTFGGTGLWTTRYKGGHTAPDYGTMSNRGRGPLLLDLIEVLE